MKILKNILVILFFSIWHISYAQTENFTNVDTTYLKPKWMSNPLSVSSYRNGKEISRINSEFDFAKTNKPAYYIKSINGNDQYFYNQNALIIKDGDTIAPFGFKVASSKDFMNFFKAMNFTSETNTNSNDKLIADSRYFLVPFNGFLIEGFFKDESEYYVWTPQKVKGSEEGLAVKFEKDVNVKFDFINQYYGYGFQIFCLENIEERAKDSIFDYKKLLPDVYNSIIDKMYSNMRSQFDINSDFAVLVNANINCSRLGNIEYNLTLLKAANEEKLKKTLVSALAEWNTVPYYHGNILMAKSDMQLTFKREVKPLKQSSLFKLNNVRSHTIDKDTLSTLISKGFKCKTSVENILITDNKEIVKKQITTTVNEFKAPSIYNSGLFIIPGLGLTTTHRNSESYKWKKIGKSFLISSISIGAISLSSKIYSNFYYSRYRNDPTGINVTSEYKKANFSQKVFLSTLGAYALLGAVDFIFTFDVSMKNKKYEKIINKQLKVGDEVILK